MLFCQIEAILGGSDVEAIAAGTDLPPDPEVLQTVIESSQAEITNLLDNITEEERKMEQYRVSLGQQLMSHSVWISLDKKQKITYFV